MKKKVATIAALIISLGTLQGAFADDAWFHGHDRDHDGHWTYEEFKRAHHEWYKQHPGERRYKEEELRAEFDRLSAEHHGWVGPDDVRSWHRW